MNVYCSRCHEEVLGAVNRCWRCGQSFSFPRSGEAAPPQRRESSLAADAILAEVLDEMPDADVSRCREPSCSAVSCETAGFALALPTCSQPTLPVIPCGSAPKSTLVLLTTSLALLLSLASLGLLWRFPAGGLALSLLGVAVGCLALRWGGWRTGSMALLTCCLAAWASSWMLAVALYVATHGVPPWSSAAPRSPAATPVSP